MRLPPLIAFLTFLSVGFLSVVNGFADEAASTDVHISSDIPYKSGTLSSRYAG